ncbi:MAG: aminodeoxychorismate synthase component I [Paracoccaceae bacterium]|jgi:para-aminobenzoate synthetase component 1
MKIVLDTPVEAALNGFHRPNCIIECDTIDQVPAALAQIDDALAQGNWVAGCLSYELGYAFEARLHERLPDQRDVPLIYMGVYDGPQEVALASPRGGVSLDPVQFEWSASDYQSRFDRAQQYIQAGDMYQVNLTFGGQTAFEGDPEALYLALRDKQPVKFGAFVDFENGDTVISRSPELFFKTDAQGAIETRPMKGTQPRHVDPAEDAAAKAFLQSDEKNRAENLMIVDLLRNDISKICQVGSVHVPDLFHIESYATVHQMVSRVCGTLRADVVMSHIIAALFPCGSITGAPKLRSMEIIHELESMPRNMYCGSIGWAAPDGRSCFNVAIRTLLLQNGQARLNVGGGVVYDSTAPSEYEEALWKARFAQICDATTTASAA